MFLKYDLMTVIRRIERLENDAENWRKLLCRVHLEEIMMLKYIQWRTLKRIFNITNIGFIIPGCWTMSEISAHPRRAGHKELPAGSFSLVHPCPLAITAWRPRFWRSENYDKYTRCTVHRVAFWRRALWRLNPDISGERNKGTETHRGRHSFFGRATISGGSRYESGAPVSPAREVTTIMRLGGTGLHLAVDKRDRSHDYARFAGSAHTKGYLIARETSPSISPALFPPDSPFATCCRNSPFFYSPISVISGRERIRFSSLFFSARGRGGGTSGETGGVLVLNDLILHVKPCTHLRLLALLRAAPLPMSHGEAVLKIENDPINSLRVQNAKANAVPFDPDERSRCREQIFRRYEGVKSRSRITGLNMYIFNREIGRARVWRKEGKSMTGCHLGGEIALFFFSRVNGESSHWRGVTRGYEASISLLCCSSFSSSYPDSGPQGWYDRGDQQDPIEHPSHGFRPYRRIAAHFWNDRALVTLVARDFNRSMPLCHISRKKKRAKQNKTNSEDDQGGNGTRDAWHARAAWKKNRCSRKCNRDQFAPSWPRSASDTGRPRRGIETAADGASWRRYAKSKK